MKNWYKKLLAPIDRLDYILLSVLGGVNVIFCIFGGFIMVLVLIAVSSITAPLVSDSNNLGELTTLLVLTIIVVALLGAGLAGAMIRKMRVWLLSLPLQFLLYFGTQCCLLPSSDNLTVAECALGAGGLVLVQLPGVAVSLLIRLIIRKIRARKQIAPAE